MADANSIVERLERISLGLDSLEKLGELAIAARLERVGSDAAGSPVAFLASTLQELVCDVIVELKAGRLEVVHG